MKPAAWHLRRKWEQEYCKNISSLESSCCFRNGAFKRQWGTRPVAAHSFHRTTFSVLRKEKSKAKKTNLKLLGSLGNWDNEFLSMTHFFQATDCACAVLLLSFSALGLHVFYGRSVPVSSTACVKYTVILLNVSNVPKHVQGSAQQAWFSQRRSQFGRLECHPPVCTSLELLFSVPGGWVSRQDTEHACGDCCYKQEIAKACKSLSSLPLPELLWSFLYIHIAF